MTKYKLMLAICLGLFLISFVSASYVETHGVPLTSQTSANSGKYGMQILVKQDITIESITKQALDGSTKGYILDSGKNVLASASFSGNTATFNYAVTAGNYYYVVGDAEGASVTHQRSASAAYNYSGNYINWTGALAADLDTTTFAEVVANITVSPKGSSLNVSLLLPANASTISDSNILFSANVTPILTNITNATINVYNYLGVLVNATTNTLTGNSTNDTSFSIGNFYLGAYTWNVRACGINLTGSSYCTSSINNSFTYGYNVNSVGYNASVYSTSTEAIVLNLSLASVASSSVVTIYYNQTPTVLTSSLDSGGNYIYTYSYAIPTVTTNTIINFSFRMDLTGINGTNTYYTSNYTQTILSLRNIVVLPDSCSAGLYPSLYFDFQDEETLAAINGTVYYNFQYGLSNNTAIATSGNLTNIKGFYLCINASYPTYNMGYGEIQYSSPTSTYVNRRYYMFNNTRIVNSTINTTLYNLLTASATAFQLEVTSTSLIPYQGIYTALIRWYPNLNSYRTIEMGKTDNIGNTIFYSKVQDVDYRIGVYNKDGTLIELADPIRMACLSSPCTYSLKIGSTSLDLTSYLNIEKNLDYNYTTGIWTFTFNDPSQKVQTINLTVYKDTGDNSYVVCSSLSSSYTGVMTCNTSAYTGNLRAVVTRTASPTTALAMKTVSVITSAFTSKFGLFLSLLIGIPIIFVFAFISPVAAIVGGVIALIPAFYFGTVNLAIIGGIAVLGGIVLHFIGRVK